jgi:dihydroxyacetone kinase-like protein
MGVALSPCVVPEVGKPSFSIGEDEMELGMGIHGEPGIDRGKLKTADDTVQIMMEKILEDLPYNSGDEVAVLVNGLGATPKEELYVMYRKAAEILKGKNIKVFKVYVGEFATSMEMAGASISILKLDGELKALLAKPANTPFFEQVQLGV